MRASESELIELNGSGEEAVDGGGEAAMEHGGDEEAAGGGDEGDGGALGALGVGNLVLIL
ncbi:hypothetical protein C2S51_001022 [Perilla frutescens var. frutescens]|nr:hypothetical protein C2S51_001022 [Perilla frutescens var. frutescens]